MNYQSNLKAVEKKLQERQERAAEAVGLLVVGKAKLLSAVDTGNLRKSNDYMVEGSVVTVGNSADYAGFVELGTRFMSAQPFLEPAVMNNRAEIKALVERYMKG